MRGIQFFVMSVVTVLAGAASTAAASTPTTTAQPAVFAVQGKLLQVGEGWLRVQVMKVQQGAGLRANANLRILETAKTTVLRTGKAASVKDLKAGEIVQISGSILRNGTTLTYQAGSVTIVR